MLSRRARASLLVDQPRVQVGVDGHLLAGHRVQGEARRHLGDASRALGDDHELDDDEDHEHHEADHEVAADHELAEGVDHRARRVGPLVPWRRMSRVAATFSESRNSVMTRSSEGKTENSSRLQDVHRHEERAGATG